MKKNEFNFKEDGLQIIYNFLNHEQIDNLRKECNFLFSNTYLMGPGYSIRLNKKVSEIPNPIAKISSVNLLEVSIDIAKHIELLGYENYKLAHVALYHEENNDKELVWHSDLRNGGLIRAQIVIQGGMLDSGAFRYVKGSHKLKTVEYAPPEGFLLENKDNIVVCNKENGSLFLIDTIGYHSKCVCINTRISLMFDFLPHDYIISNPNDVVSDYHLSTSKITNKVIDNINLIRTEISPTTKSENTYDFYKFYKPFGGSNISDFLKVIKRIVKNRL